MSGDLEITVEVEGAADFSSDLDRAAHLTLHKGPHPCPICMANNSALALLAAGGKLHPNCNCWVSFDT